MDIDCSRWLFDELHANTRLGAARLGRPGRLRVRAAACPRQVRPPGGPGSKRTAAPRTERGAGRGEGRRWRRPPRGVPATAAQSGRTRSSRSFRGDGRAVRLSLAAQGLLEPCFTGFCQEAWYPPRAAVRLTQHLGVLSEGLPGGPDPSGGPCGMRGGGCSGAAAAPRSGGIRRGLCRLRRGAEGLLPSRIRGRFRLGSFHRTLLKATN